MQSDPSMGKMKRPWTGKKEKTNSRLKEAHQERKVKKELVNSLKEQEWHKQVKEYDYK